MPQLLTRVDTEYPPLARAAGIEGIVGVKFSIDKTGRVTTAEIERKSSSNAGFEDACIQAGKRNLWIPAYSQGKPIPYWSYYEVIFIHRGIKLEAGEKHDIQGNRQEGLNMAASDTVIEIHEIYDIPPMIEKTEAVHHSGEASTDNMVGSLWLRAVIDGSGKVRYAVILQSSLGDSLLKDALVEAFCNYTFKPALYREKPVAVQVECEIVFAQQQIQM